MLNNFNMIINNTQKSNLEKLPFMGKNYLLSFSKAILNFEQNRLEEVTMVSKPSWPQLKSGGLSMFNLTF